MCAHGEAVEGAEALRTQPKVKMGSMADIVPDRQVQVRGMLSGDGTRLEATPIRFGH